MSFSSVFPRFFGLFFRVAIVLFLAALPVLNLPLEAALAAPVGEVVEPARSEPAPLLVATPTLILGVPATTMIGSAFSFTATFDNTGAPPNEVGYGPFIDLVFPATGMDGDDGVTFVGASYLGAAIPADQLFIQTFPDDDGAGPGTTGCVQHPIAVRPANDPPIPSDTSLPRYYQVCGTAGDQFVTIILPFGSFVPDQPPAVVTIDAQMSNLADLGAPLGITGQAGFRFGYTPINDFCCSPFDATIPVQPGGIYDTTNTVAFPRQNVTPTIMTLAKEYVGPEDETATGPNFPRQFTITVDVAEGQTITNMVITDTLPGNIQFVSLDSVVPAAASTSLPSTSSPGGTLSATIASVTGGAGETDASLTFTFFVDRAVSGTPIINPSTGVFVDSDNTADVVGDWNPVDPRDIDSSPTATCGVPCVTISDQSLAIQKGVANITDGSNSPGDVLQYTLNFQISDFFGFQNLNLTDTFSDGQRFDSSYTPRLTLNGNPNNLAAVSLAAANVDVSCNYTGAALGAGCDSLDPAANDGQTTITFNLSDELNTQFSNPQLLGGCVNPASANNPPNCSTYNNGATTGTITFRTVIQDQFSDDYPSGDQSVDHGDLLGNAVDFAGSVLNIAAAPVSGQFSPTGQPAVTDDSGAGVTIAFGGLTKSIYAVNGSTSIPAYLSPLDVVTYRLTYTQPASDFEVTTFTDYLPLPVFDVTELGTLNNSVCGIPAAGIICLGPSDNYHNLNSRGENVPPGNPVVVPTYATDGPSNRLTITYPAYDSVFNISSTIDILFSVTVTDDPFADGMFLTNQVNAAEGTTNAGDQELDDIVQIRLGQPVLRIGKTAVSTDHVPAADITFIPDVSALMGEFELPGVAGPAFTPTISTSDLSSQPNDPAFAFDLFNSTMYGPDNQDLIKYAIVIENKGNSADGAYDIAISDILPPGMTIPTNATGLNLQITRGDGTVFGFEVVDFGGDGEYGTADDVVTPGDASNAMRIFDPGYAIRVVDPSGTNVPGACQVHDLVGGANIIVVTYDLLLNNASPASNSIINTASLHGYAGSEGGPNHLPEPIDDDAEVITAGVQLNKTLVSTEFDVAGNNAASQAVIGEIVTYELEAKFFELNTLGAQIVDTLAPGLAFVDVVSITASNVDTDGVGTDTGLTSSVMTFDGGTGLCTNCTAGTSGGSNPFVQNSGETLTFNFGDVNNTDSDNTVAETVTIVYRAIVTNVIGNQAGATLNNTAEISWTGMPSAPVTVTTPNVTVVEPVVTIVKNASASTALDAGDPLVYNFSITSSVTNAYDVTFSDPLPLYFTPNSLPAGSFTATKNPGAVDVSAQFQLVGASAPYTFQTIPAANIDLLPGDTITIAINGTISYAAPANATLTNTATVYWTSLDDGTIVNPATVIDRSSYNPDSDERTGADGVGGALNDYAGESVVVTSVTNPLVLSKELISTSEGHTSNADVAIGEIARFRLIVEVPEGTNQSLLFEDSLPFGLTFLNDGTARMAFICNGPAPCATSSLHAGTSWIVTGASGAVTPTYVLPDGAVSSSRTLNEDVYSTGVPVVFKFGDLINNDNDADREYAVVEFNVLVDNSLAGSNDNGDTRDNTFQAFVNLSQSGNTGGPVTLTVREPNIPFNSTANNKTASPTTGQDAGNTINYTVTYTNLGTATAFEVRILDNLDAAYLDLTIGSVATNGADLDCAAPTVTNNSDDGANRVDVTVGSVPVNCTVAITYSAVLTTSVVPGQTYLNTANITYTSLPGAGTTGNPTGSNTPGGSGAVNGERDGSGGVNDYNGSDSASVAIANVAVQKAVIATSESHTSAANVTIGEIVRYRLAVQVPEGSITNFQMRDALPPGLTFLNDGSARYVYISANATSNISATAYGLPADAFYVPAVNSTNILLPGLSTLADVLNPALLSSGSVGGVFPNTNNISANNNNNSDTYNTGTDVSFKFGDLVNADNDIGNEFVVVEFNALVDNNLTDTNDRGDVRGNTFRVQSGAGPANLGPNSAIVNVTIVEPGIPFSPAANNKTVTSPLPATNIDAGDVVNYQIVYTNAFAPTASDAFDVVIIDDMGAAGLPFDNLTYLNTTFGSGCGAPVVSTTGSTGTRLEVSVSQVPVSCTVTITYQATATTSISPFTTYVNTANIRYSSLPGNNGTSPNGTLSTTPGTPGSLTGERNHDNTATGGANNDYRGSDTAQVTSAPAQPVKSITSTSESHTGDATADTAGDPRPVVVGEILRYRLAVQLPEGTSNDFIITDQLAANIQPFLDDTMRVTAVNFSAGNFDSLDFGVALEAASGSPVSLYDAGGTPQFTAPFNLVTLSGGNLLTFNLGDLRNLDLNDADAEYIYIEFNVLVTNDSNNTLGDIFANDFDVTINGGSPATSNEVVTEVVEPQLNVTKADDDADGLWVYGQTPVTYTITVEHTGASNAIAFDIVVTDTIPAGLTYIPASISAPAGWVADDSAAPALSWNCASPACSMPLAGGPVNLTYAVTVNDQFTTPHLEGDDTAVNTANLTWTSLPGTGTTGNPTGSDTPGGSGDSDGERNGTDPVVQPNDYSDSAQHTGELVDYYSIGNRVWFDTDNNGTMDAGEQPVDGVLVQLYSASDLTTVLASDVTTAGGFYLFDYLVPGDYVVAVAADNFVDSGVGDTYTELVGYWSSLTSISGVGVISETSAPDADTIATDADDNGQLNLFAVELPGAVVAQAVTLGPSGLTEPTGEVAAQLESGVLGDQGAQPDGRANLTVDFGFYRIEIGNLIYRDENANGTFNSGTDTPLQNVTVELLSGNGLAVLDTTITNASGEYEFVGWPEGDYRVRVTTPSGHVSTIDTANSADTTDPDGEVDENDNGIGIGPATITNVTSGQLTMDAGEAGGTLTVTPASGTTRDEGLDFGFTYAYALGNRVWFDTDNSSDINGSEVGVNGVTVQLYRADGSGNPTGAVLATDTTANGGYYLFDSLTAGDYVVVLPASNFAAGAVLEGYWSSDTSMDGVGIISETAAPDPDGSPDADSDDNGELDLFGSLPGAVASRAVTLGPTGLTELTGETDVNGLAPGVDNQGLQPDGRANMAVDFGFYRVEIGDLVYFDANRDGTYAVLDGDTAMDNANVRLYSSDNLTEIQVGPDGVLGTADDAAGGVAASSGLYLFSGLPEGDYVIRATPTSTGVTSTTDAFNQADNDDPDVNADDNDNGDGTAPGQVSSAVLTMDAAESAVNISVDNPTGTTTDLTVDFGFVEMVALGNRVWLDTGVGAGGVVDDGIQNGTEPGVENVRVELYTSGGTFVTFDTTDANGDYYFDLLYPGSYYVLIPATEFQSGGDLEGYVSSTGNGLVDVDSDQDVDENGIDEADLAANGIRTPIYTLEPNTEPTADTDTGYTGSLDDDNVNLTADFGFLQFVAIGNRIWLDTGAGSDYNNGILDGGETPVDGVAVELYTLAGVLVDTTVTSGGGYYEFDMLLSGQYYVQIPASMFDAVAPSPLAGYVSSLGYGLAGDDDDNNADENGIDIATLATTGIRSPDYDLQPNGEPTAEDQSNYTGSLDDNNVNFTADFSFTQLVGIGNRVWFDTGAGGATADDGIQSGAELGVENVRVELYTSTGTFVAFDTTDANGDYYFDLLNPGAYYVSIPANQFDDAGDALYGYVSSTGNGGVNDDDDQDLDENGIDEANLPANGIRTPNYTLSPDGEPSAADNDSGYTGYLDDDNVNLTADFGFLQKVAIGNIVWLDNGVGGGTANNGILDGGEAGIEFVTVQLYDSANTLVASTVTDADGYYGFDNLLPGSYYLVIPAAEFQTGGDLRNLLSSSGNGADEVTNETGDENGIDSATPATTGITSTVFDLQPNGEQTGEPQPNYTGALDDNNVNFTADFGFTELVALGNRVWFDTGAGAFYNNGILDVGETAVDDVTVELYTVAGTLVDTTTTSGGGYYEFDLLLPGQYYVQIPAAEFQLGGELFGYVSSLGAVANETGDQDVDENGIDIVTLTTTGIRTQDYTLQPNAERAGEDQTNYSGALDDDNVNFTADFAFTRLVAIGNRIWLDTGAGGGTADDGIQSGSEAGVEDVTVELYRSGDTPGVDAPVATDVTDANGDYYFDLLNPGSYFVHIPAAEFQAGGDLEGYVSSTGNGTSELLDQDVDENGIDEPALATNGISTPDYTLAPDAEPSADSDTGYTGYLDDDNVNLTADFGFLQFVAIGNRVWLDTGAGAFYNNGILDVGETPVDGVTVELYTAAGVLVDTTATSGGGYYAFDMLLPGQYYVQIPASMFDATAPSPLEGYVSTTVTGVDEVSDNNADENGIDVATLATTGIRTQVYDLQPNTETIADDQVNYTGVLDDDNVNFTADFSFVRLVAIGNRVWMDAGLLGGVPNNGRQDGGEQGIGGVDVQLFLVGQNPATDTPVATDTTDANGNYEFDLLNPGDYFVHIPASEFQLGGTLEGLFSSAGNGSDETTDQDLDENGIDSATMAADGVSSTPYNLTPDTETADDDETSYTGYLDDDNVNFTADFGFLQLVAIGNIVWEDSGAGGGTANNGILDGAEPGIPGVDLQLYQVGDVPGTDIPVDTTTAVAGGYYFFDNLLPGDYFIFIPAAEFQGTATLAGYTSSTGNGADETTDETGDENGIDNAAPWTNGITSTVYALQPNGEPSGEPQPNYTGGLGDNDVNFTADFGFYNNPQVNLGVTKDDGTTYYLAGGTLTYTVTVVNNGPIDVTGLTVSDTRPTQITSWNWACTSSAPNPAPATYGCTADATNPSPFTDDLDLPVGASVRYTVTANVDVAATGTLTNAVSVTPPSGVVDNNSTNDNDQDVDQPASLDITKDDGLTVVAPGSVITYTIEVTNNGAVDLTSLTVEDVLPSDLTYQSANPAPTSVAGNTLTWTPLSLLAGASTTITVTAQVNAEPIAANLINTVTVTDANTGLSDTADDVDIVAANNGKSIISTNEPSTVAPQTAIGEIITYQIRLDVPVGATFSNLRALDVLDSGLAFVRCVRIDAGALTTTLPGGFADACNAPLNPVVLAEPVGDPGLVNQGRRVQFDLGSVTNPDAMMATLIVEYEAVLLNVAGNEDGVSGLNNNVIWTWDGGSLNSSAPPLEVVEPDMSIEKDATPSVAPYGSTITFTLDIAHTVESTADAFDVVVTDILPPGLAFVPGTVTTTGLAPDVIDYSGTTLTFVWNVFPLGETSVLSFQATFVGPAPVTNTADLAWTSLPIDPGLGGEPVQQSDYNDYSTERWYDPPASSGVNNYGVSSSATITIPELPATGFAPGRISVLPAQPAEKSYNAMDNMWLEIPDLGVVLPIVGVPLSGEGWDLTWLSNQAGYLNGTTLPGDVGTTGLTAHVTLADGTPGPFRNLNRLYWGNKVILHVDGYRYTYEVRENRSVLPRDLSVFKKDGYTWLTLLTCEGYVPWLDTYNYRLAVRAVLLKVEPDSTVSPFPAPTRPASPRGDRDR